MVTIVAIAVSSLRCAAFVENLIGRPRVIG